MDMKKLSKGGSLQYMGAVFILCIYLYGIMMGGLPSIEITAIFFGLIVVTLLAGIGFEVREGFKRRK